MKKVVQHSDMWHCIKCNGASIGCDYRYVLLLQLHDHTGHLENGVSFDDVATELLGVTTKDLCLLSSELKSIGDISTKIKCLYYLFTLFVRTETFNGIERLFTTLMHSEEIPYASASTLLLHVIK